MKNKFLWLLVVALLLVFSSCASMPSTSRDRVLSIGEYSIPETAFGGVERWYAVDKYNYDSLVDEVRFQVGYFIENKIGFVLYGNGTMGVEAYFSRDGLNLRWDWGSDGYGSSFKYSFIIEPDGTGLYYEFSASKDGTAKPRGIYKVRKF